MRELEPEPGLREGPVEAEVSLLSTNFRVLERGAGAGDGSGLNIYTSESAGLKVSPKTVLITSLIYVGIVVFLHIW